MIHPRIEEPRRARTLHVACAANRNWVPHCAAMLHSLVAHQGGQVHVHFIGDQDVTPGIERQLSEMIRRLGAEISTYRVRHDRIRGLPDYGPPTQWFRILLPELLPVLDRVLYLDVDLIVTDSLDRLWRLDLADHLVAAVTQVFHSPEWADRHCEAMGVSRRDYFNCGVLLLNLGELRRNDWTRKIRDFALTHADSFRSQEVQREECVRETLRYVVTHPDRLLFPDQDSINAVHAGRRLSLHPRWNCMHQMVRFPWSKEVFGGKAWDEALRKPAIRHFEGPAHSKPWHPKAEPWARRLYWEHRNHTPWADERLPVGDH